MQPRVKDHQAIKIKIIIIISRCESLHFEHSNILINGRKDYIYPRI